MTVIGIRKTSFEGRDRETGKKTGEKIEGFNIYITQPISDKVGTGVSADRIFLTEKRMDEIFTIPRSVTRSISCTTATARSIASRRCDHGDPYSMHRVLPYLP